MSLLEMFLLISTALAVETKLLFEIGTFLGGTTLNFAQNLPGDAHILTLDLGENDLGAIQQDDSDRPLTEMYWQPNLISMGRPIHPE